MKSASPRCRDVNASCCRAYTSICAGTPSRSASARPRSTLTPRIWLRGARSTRDVGLPGYTATRSLPVGASAARASAEGAAGAIAVQPASSATTLANPASRPRRVRDPAAARNVLVIARSPCGSIEVDARGLHHLVPARDLARDQLAEGLRRGRRGLRPFVGEARAHLLQRECLVHLLVQARDD